MTDKVLSEGEMDALMEGVESGDVPVQTGAGIRNARVEPFEIHPRAHLSIGSYPELQRLNEKLAVFVQRYCRDELAWEVSCDLKSQSVVSLADLDDRYTGLMLGVQFSLPPLEGQGLMVLDDATLGALVDKFFGSASVGSRISSAERFSAGEVRIATRFSEAVLEGISESWMSLVRVEPSVTSVEQSMERIQLGAGRERAVLARFGLASDTFGSEFSLAIPLTTLGELVDSLEGAEQPGSAEQNARWLRILREHAINTEIPLVARTRPIRLPLGRVSRLSTGDVLPLSDPAVVSLSSGDVELSIGDFGVYNKHFCVRHRHWLAEAPDNSQRMAVNG